MTHHLEFSSFYKGIIPQSVGSRCLGTSAVWFSFLPMITGIDESERHSDTHSNIILSLPQSYFSCSNFSPSPKRSRDLASIWLQLLSLSSSLYKLLYCGFLYFTKAFFFFQQVHKYHENQRLHGLL